MDGRRHSAHGHRRRAPLAAVGSALAVAGLGCGQDEAFRELWVARLIELGEHERALDAARELPADLRQSPEARTRILFAHFGRAGFSPTDVVRLLATFSAPDAHAVGAGARELRARHPELSSNLARVARGLARPADPPQVRGFLGGAWILGALARLEQASPGSPPSAAVEVQAARELEAALRYARDAAAAPGDSVSPGLAAIGRYARLALTELERLEPGGGSEAERLRAWLEGWR